MQIAVPNQTMNPTRLVFARVLSAFASVAIIRPFKAFSVGELFCRQAELLPGNPQGFKRASMKLVFDLDNEKAKVNLKKCRAIFNLCTDPSPLVQDDIRIED